MKRVNVSVLMNQAIRRTGGKSRPKIGDQREAMARILDALAALNPSQALDVLERREWRPVRR
jgi:hypothetical protein